MRITIAGLRSADLTEPVELHLLRILAFGKVADERHHFVGHCLKGEMAVLSRWKNFGDRSQLALTLSAIISRDVRLRLKATAGLARATVVSGFVDSLQEPRTPYISPNRLSKALGVLVTGLAELTGVHRNTLHNPSSERLRGRMRRLN